MTQPSIIAGTADGVAPSLPMETAASEWALWERSINRLTLEAMGVASGTAFFPDAGCKLPALFFKYDTGWKARSYPDKHFVASKGFKLCFWNISRVIAANPEEIFITEGEFDSCALVEAGIPADRVLSVPNGAKLEASDSPKNQPGYSYVLDALEAGLNRAKRFIWCGDSDNPGAALRSDMARLLGVARFLFVTWPNGVKDANEMLGKYGAAELREMVTQNAKEWPINGVFRLREIPAPPQLMTWLPGFPEWENKIRLAPRTLSVVTGHPGHGKTALWQQIWFQVVRDYGVVFCTAAFETQPKPFIRRQLRSLIHNKLEKDLTEEEKQSADEWIEDRYLFMVHPDRRPTLDWFLEMAEAAVIRHGARIIQLDPWNRLESQRDRNENETEYIARCLRALYDFSHDMNCHVQIIAHPAKMDGMRKGFAPLLDDISGSKNWDNMVDQGFVVHRPEMIDKTTGAMKTTADLYHRKARFSDLGYPCKLSLNYQLDRGKYVSIDYETLGTGT